MSVVWHFFLYIIKPHKHRQQVQFSVTKICVIFNFSEANNLKNLAKIFLNFSLVEESLNKKTLPMLLQDLLFQQSMTKI